MRKYLATRHDRYSRVGRQHKSRIFGEFCANCGATAKTPCVCSRGP